MQIDSAYLQFVQGIRFIGGGPMSLQLSAPKFDAGDLERSPWNKWLDVANTQLADNDLNYKRLLAPILDMPRMSSFAIASIIQRSVENLAPDECYLNIGCWHGFSLLAGMLNQPQSRIVGVDNFSKFGGPREQFLSGFEKIRSENHTFFEMVYGEYFDRHHEGKIGLYFYDGDHSFDHQYNGLVAAEPYFADQSIVLVDDTNRPEPYEATLKFIEDSKHTYEIVLDEKTASDGHATYWNGLLVLRKVA